jgi:uncharacterized membrane protein YidH (DUF202 family)
LFLFFIIGHLKKYAMPEEPHNSQVKAMETLVALAREQTALAVKRNEMSAQRSYMNAERTLSVWIRTALSAMIFGIAIDRLGLMYQGTPARLFQRGIPSTVMGAVLVAFAIFVALSAGLRFIGFTSAYKKEHSLPEHHKAALPVAYTFLTIIFGTALLFLMFWLD